MAATARNAYHARRGVAVPVRPAPPPAVATDATGVKCVVVMDTSNLLGTRTELIKTVQETLGGVKQGIWEVQYAVHTEAAVPLDARGRPIPRAKPRNPQPYLQVVTLPECPQAFYLSRHTTLLQADTQLEGMLGAVLKVTKPRVTGRIDGVRYKVGDFTVCIGTCKIKGKYRSVVVEVGYTPCSLVASGTAIVRDFLFSLGRPEEQKVMAADLVPGLAAHPTYCHAHTACQYIRAFESS